jgi:hypothetical protein
VEHLREHGMIQAVVFDLYGTLIELRRNTP